MTGFSIPDDRDMGTPARRAQAMVTLEIDGFEVTVKPLALVGPLRVGRRVGRDFRVQCLDFGEALGETARIELRWVGPAKRRNALTDFGDFHGCTGLGRLNWLGVGRLGGRRSRCFGKRRG